MARTASPLPAWNSYGVLPPVGLVPTAPAHRSPYPVSLIDFVTRFGTTDARRAIISGFLRFRAELARAGLVSGFQWINGSFLEHIEQIEARDPRDIDVVTFFHTPDDQTQEALLRRAAWIADRRDTKNRYSVDAYYVHLGSDSSESLVAQATYWNSLWSHRWDGRWKGYVQIELTPTDDPAARASLDTAGITGDEE